MKPRDALRPVVCGLCLTASLLAVGCAGGGRVGLVALDYQSIDPLAPQVSQLDVDRCYWWTDEDGKAWVAMECVTRPLLGMVGPFRFQMSLVLDKLPAGKERNYTVAKRELRALARLGPMESRFVSVAGVVGLHRDSEDRLRGSFRLRVSRAVSQLLGGWSPPSSYLMFGSFQAVRNAERGQAIVAATESQGWERDADETSPAPTDESAEPQLDERVGE